MRELALDVRDAQGMLEALREARPEVVVHLAGAAARTALAAGPGGHL